MHQLGFEILPIQAEDDYSIYTLKGHINLDCKSPECDQKNEFNYTLDIYLLFLKSTDFVYEKSSGSFLNNYQWKIQNHHEINVFSTGQKEAILFLENNLTDYPIYAIGYRKIAIAITNETNQSEKIDKTLHLLDLNINVKNFRPLSTNQILINQEIFFNNWRKHMKKINFHSSFAFRQKGSFKGEVKLAVFRFKEAEISTSGYNEGKIEWKANNANPDADSIKKVKIIAIDAENLLA